MTTSSALPSVRCDVMSEPLSYVDAASFGNSRIALSDMLTRIGTIDQHPRGDEQTGAAGERGRLAPAPRQQPLERRADVGVEVRDAGRVGEDVVAVGADDRREVLDDLQQLQGDQQQQRVGAHGPPHGEREDGDDDVEVDPAEVGAQAGAPREAVGVGDVGVEGGPDHVDAGAHAARPAAAEAARRGVPDLVERRRGDGEAEHEQQQLRIAERLGGRRGDALVDEHEPEDHGEAREHREHQPRAEQVR